MTLLVALVTLGLCAGVRKRLTEGKTGKRGWRDCFRIEPLWNDGAAFGLPFSAKAAAGISAALLAGIWRRRKGRPVASGLLLGGGLSNLLERLRYGRVFDYLRFPKAPGPLKRYVYNLADLAVLTGAALVLRQGGKR